MSSAPQQQPNQPDPSGRPGPTAQPAGAPHGGLYGSEPATSELKTLRTLSFVLLILSGLGLMYTLVSTIIETAQNFSDDPSPRDAASLSGADVASGAVGLVFIVVALITFVLAIIVAVKGSGQIRRGAIICGAMQLVNLAVIVVVGLIIGALTVAAAGADSFTTIAVAALVMSVLTIIVKAIGTFGAWSSYRSAETGLRSAAH
ncbi:hypothetical protein [Helcobacillus massiliensis]|uniref:Uncharacterized membrane protein YidH (DUF202 family) n=1 Tax=Helcobacillus massiliensis TaxID=521392 RepID=A0A839R0C9_9MICO|nr:hypothetical protein [Helcobacillus massiliensis]MBB3023177.1 uncharacterized membrane protein YidH (DUF202 family) [Helcobacillus massiliensis]